MLLPKQTNSEYRTEFLLRFTKEILENTDAYQKAKARAGVQEFMKKGEQKKEKVKEEIGLAREIQKKEIKNIVQTKIQGESKRLSDMKSKSLSEMKLFSFSAQQPRGIFKKPALKIPELLLPATVSYLKPTPTSEGIDLGKLNVLVQDPMVKIIECNGPEENIFVGGSMGRKPTTIRLSEEEIEEILGKFSSASKIPVNEGLFKAAMGNVILSAVISDIVGIKFVIRKISKEF